MRVTGLFEKMENQRTNFPKCKDILDSSDEEDEEAQGSTFIEKTNKRSSAPTEELLFCQKQVLSIPESDSGGDEPILSKRAKTDILNRLKRSSSSFLSYDDSFISDNAAASSFCTPFQPVSKKLVKFNSTPNYVAKSNGSYFLLSLDLF